MSPHVGISTIFAVKTRDEYKKWLARFVEEGFDTPLQHTSSPIVWTEDGSAGDADGAADPVGEGKGDGEEIRIPKRQRTYLGGCDATLAWCQTRLMAPGGGVPTADAATLATDRYNRGSEALPRHGQSSRFQAPPPCFPHPLIPIHPFTHLPIHPPTTASPLPRGQRPRGRGPRGARVRVRPRGHRRRLRRPGGVQRGGQAGRQGAAHGVSLALSLRCLSVSPLRSVTSPPRLALPSPPPHRWRCWTS